MPVALMDILAAHQLKEGLMLALIHRMRTGEGMHIDASLYDSAIASLANQASTWLNTAEIPKRMGSQHPNIAPYGDKVQTSDQKELLLAIGTDGQFKNFCDIIGCGHVPISELFSTNTARVKNRIDLMQILNEACIKLDSHALLQKCKDYQVPISPINKLNEVLSDPKSIPLILHQTEEDGTISKRVKTVVFKAI
jgi:crotonobetainyl-CoA:carnitine CoA-transferase CaiB-like acyl-CoA transferase